MIAAHGFVACFKVRAANGEKTYTDRRPVIAWSDDGEAMIADTGKGTLVPARSRPNFEFLDFDEQPIAAVPGGGWLMHWPDDDGKTVLTEPVVAWLVSADGSATALSTDENGYAERVRDSVADRPTFSHPSQVAAATAITEGAKP